MEKILREALNEHPVNVCLVRTEVDQRRTQMHLYYVVSVTLLRCRVSLYETLFLYINLLEHFS